MSSSSSERSESRHADDATLSGSVRRGLRQRIPYRMFGKRLDSTKRLVVSSKVWMKTIPTNNCDILLTFPTKTEDSTLMWLLARLKTRTPQIIVHVRHHSNSNIHGFYMTATYENLLKGAEELGIKKPLKSDYGGGMKEFTFEDQDCFAGVEEEKSFLSSQERQFILYHLLCELRALDGEQLGKIKFLEAQPIIPRLESNKIISQVFPLHCKEDLKQLRKSWVQAICRKQPLQMICEYFGVKIALYFAYLGHYTASLCIPAFLGVVFWLIQDSQEMEDVCFVLYALFNVLWATLYLEHWKRTSSELAYKWGTLDKKDDLLKEPRPLYKGDLVKSPVTGRMQPSYPSWKRNLFAYLVSFPVIGVCLFVVFAVMLLIFELQEWLNGLIAAGDIPAFLRFCPKILLALCISVFDELYRIVAVWLNDKENYRLEETYGNRLIIKLVLFVNSFLSLFYIAFYLRDMDRLREQLAALLITRQVIGNLKEAIMPYLVWKARLLKVGLRITGQMSPSSLDKEIREMTQGVRRRRLVEESPVTEEKVSEETTANQDKETHHHEQQQNLSSKITNKEKMDDPVPDVDQSLNGERTSGPTLTQAEVESAMKKYEDTFEDYLEMFIQFGYVTLFSSAFPLAALCALLNNIMEVRSDAFKLCFNHQRPFGQQVEDIGIWQDALEVMGVIAVVVNCALIGMSGLTKRMFPEINDVTTIIVIIVLEFWLAYIIPDVPDWVAKEMAKVEFQRREALKRLEQQTSPAIQSPDIRRRCVPENNSAEDPRGQGRQSEGPIVRSPHQVPSSLPGLRSNIPNTPQPPPRPPITRSPARAPAPSQAQTARSPDQKKLVSGPQKRLYHSTDPWSEAHISDIRGHPVVQPLSRCQSASAVMGANAALETNRSRSVPKSFPGVVSTIPETEAPQQTSDLVQRDVSGASHSEGSSVDDQRRLSSNRQQSARNVHRRASDSQFHSSVYTSTEEMMNAQNSESRRRPPLQSSDPHIFSKSST